jgi:TolA-binding protein
MRFITAIMVCALSCTAASAAVHRPVAHSAIASASRSSTASAQTTHTDDADSLRDDLKKMRALVQQMETNLAFVDSTQTPLRHQFQLEIDMWKTVIDHMEKRLNASKAH